METPTSKPAVPQDWREGRRFRAWELFQRGWKVGRIAEALGVTHGAVSQWLTRARRGGVEALRHRKAPGAKPKLSAEQVAHLPTLLARGAEAYGFRGVVWTEPRVAHVIEREFGVTYHPSQVGRILKRLRWTRQKPMRRARQRNEEAIRRWREERWPALKKAPPRRAGRSSA